MFPIIGRNPFNFTSKMINEIYRYNIDNENYLLKNKKIIQYLICKNDKLHIIIRKLKCNLYYKNILLLLSLCINIKLLRKLKIKKKKLKNIIYNYIHNYKQNRIKNNFSGTLKKRLWLITPTY